MILVRIRGLTTAIVLLVLAGIVVPVNLAAQKIVITYYSQTGHTKQMAEAVAKGARGVAGAEVRLLTIDKTSKEDLLWADAIVVGSPVQMTSVAAPVMQAMYAWPYPNLKDKIGAAFVTGGGISGGEELTQVQLLHVLLMGGMIVVGGPDWSQPFGASAITMEKPFGNPQRPDYVDATFLAKGEALGKRVAEVARRFVAPAK